MATDDPRKTPFYRTLYFRVLVGIVAGVALGFAYPTAGAAMKPLGDGFIKLIRMMIAPIIFFTVVGGIANIGDLGRLGRVGLKALFYFEVVTTVALLVGLAVVKVVQPGAGVNADPATLDPAAIRQYTSSAQQLHGVDFILNIIPDTLVGAFSRGEILQVLLVAILFGVALSGFAGRKPLIDAVESLTHLTFRVIGLIMQLAPFGAFGAMAFTIGKYGIATLLPLARLLLCVLHYQHPVRIRRAGRHRLGTRLQHLEVRPVHQRGAADRARHLLVGSGAATADSQAGEVGV
jgi:aerobic C4-dicarboxylate transport protein